MPDEDVYPITEPLYFRVYRPGGKGGWGFTTGPWHRATALTRTGYELMCGASGTTGYKQKYTTRNQPPRDEYPLCPICWPKEG